MVHVPSGRRYLHVDTATIELAPMPEPDIHALVDEGDVMYCAGALMVENARVVPFVQSINGSIDSVLGLSMATVEVGMLAVAEAANSTNTVQN